MLQIFFSSATKKKLKKLKISRIISDNDFLMFFLLAILGVSGNSVIYSEEFWKWIWKVNLESETVNEPQKSSEKSIFLDTLLASRKQGGNLLDCESQCRVWNRVVKTPLVGLESKSRCSNDLIKLCYLNTIKLHSKTCQRKLYAPSAPQQENYRKNVSYLFIKFFLFLLCRSYHFSCYFF
jgi:hypothetical protein